METFSALLGVCEGNPPLSSGFPSQSQWRGALMFSLICTWTNDGANNRDAGDLRCHCVHCNVTVIIFISDKLCSEKSRKGNVTVMRTNFIINKTQFHTTIFHTTIIHIIICDWLKIVVRWAQWLCFGRNNYFNYQSRAPFINMDLL